MSYIHGRVVRSNASQRTIKDATVKHYRYQLHDHLKQHLHAFLMAYDSDKRQRRKKGSHLMNPIANHGQPSQNASQSTPTTT